MQESVELVIENPPDVDWEGPREEETWNVFNVSNADFFCGIERSKGKGSPYDVEYRCERSPFLAMILTRIILKQMGDQQARDALDALPNVTLGDPKRIPRGQEKVESVRVYVMKEEKRIPDVQGLQQTTLFDMFRMATTKLSEEDLNRLAKTTPRRSWWDALSNFFMPGPEEVKHAWDRLRIVGADERMTMEVRLYQLVTHLRLEALEMVLDVINTLGTRMSASFVELDPKFVLVYHDWRKVRRIGFEIEAVMNFSVHLKMYDFAVTSDLLRSKNELKLSDVLLDFLSGGKLKAAVRLLTSDKKYVPSDDAQRLIIRLLYASGKTYAPNIGGLYEHFVFRCLMNREMDKQIKLFSNVKKMDVHTHNEELPKILTDFRQYVGEKMKEGSNPLVGEEYQPESGPETVADPTLTYSAVISMIRRNGFGSDFFTAQKTPGSVWLSKMSDLMDCVDVADRTMGFQILERVALRSSPPWSDESLYLESVMRDIDSSEVGEDAFEILRSALVSKSTELIKIIREKAIKGGINYLTDQKSLKKPVTLNEEAFRSVATTSDTIRQILAGNWKLADAIGNPTGCVVKEEEVGPKSYLAGGKQGKVYLLVFDRRKGKKPAIEVANISKNTSEYFKRLDDLIESHQKHKHGAALSYVRMLIIRNIISFFTSESALDLMFAVQEVGEIVDYANEFADGDEWVGSEEQKNLHDIVNSPLPPPLASNVVHPPGFKEDKDTIDRAVDELMAILRIKPSEEMIGDVGGLSGLEEYVRNLTGKEAPVATVSASLYGNVRNAVERILMISYVVPDEMPLKSKKEGLTIEEFMRKKFEAKAIEDAKRYESPDYEIGAIKRFPIASLDDMKTEWFDAESKEIRSSENVNEILNTLICSIHYEEGLCPFFIRSYGGFTCAATDGRASGGISQSIANLKEIAKNPQQFALDLILKQTIGIESKMLIEPTPAPAPKAGGMLTTFLTMELIDDTLANFPRLYATLYDKFYRHMTENRPTYHECLTNALQQSVMGLAYFQKYMQGMHCDLHPGNIFIKICDRTLFNGAPICDYAFFECTIGDKTFRIRNLGFLCKVGDMGHAALKVSTGGDRSEKTVRKIPPASGLKSLAEFVSQEDQYYALRRILSVAFKFVPMMQILAIADVRIGIERIIGAQLSSISPGSSVFSWISATSASFVASNVLFSIPSLVARASKLSLGSGAIQLAFDLVLPDFLRSMAQGLTASKTAAKDLSKEDLRSRNDSSLYLWLESKVFAYLAGKGAGVLSTELNKLINPVRVRNSGAFYPGYDLGTLINGCAYNKMLWLNPVISYYFQLESQEHMRKYGNLKNVQFMEFGDGFPQLLSLGTNYFYPDPDKTLVNPYDLLSRMLEPSPEVSVPTQKQKVQNAIRPRAPPPPLPPKPAAAPPEHIDYPGTHVDPGTELTDALELGDDVQEVAASGKHHGRSKKTEKKRKKCHECSKDSTGFSCQTCTGITFCSQRCNREHFKKNHVD